MADSSQIHYSRPVSAVSFGAVVLSALLPFGTVTCDGEPMLTVTGVELVTGRIETGSSGSGREATEEADPEPLAVATFAIAVAGLVVAVAVGSAAISAGLGAAGLASLLALSYRLDAQVAAETGGAAEMRWEMGFWVVLGLFVLVVVLSGLSLFVARTAPRKDG